MLAFCACTTPAKRFDHKARHYGFHRYDVVGAEFNHAVYWNGILPSSSSRRLHVYLGGDGSPWFNSRIVTKDPTPQQPLMLQLMSLDDTASIYIGRPCYHDRVEQDECHPELWTTKRYSETVVNSMRVALQEIRQKFDTNRLRIFGFSGGGTLAILLAARIPKQIDSVVTIAANLDIDAWTQHHDFTPLRGSLNPATQHSLDPNILQLHLFGEQDKNVPQQINKRYFKVNPNAKLSTYSTYDHHCCWAVEWENVLAKLQ